MARRVLLSEEEIEEIRESKAIVTQYRVMGFTNERKKQFFRAIALSGSLTRTCKALHISPHLIIKHRKFRAFESRLQNAYERFGRSINNRVTAEIKSLRIPFCEGMRRSWS